MKKATPARARLVSKQVPLRATKMGVGQQEAQATYKTIGNQNDRGKTELKDLKAQLQSHNGSKGRAAQVQVGLTLEKIRAKFGETEFQKAVKDFQITFDGINPLRNKAPGTSSVQ